MFNPGACLLELKQHNFEEKNFRNYVKVRNNSHSYSPMIIVDHDARKMLNITY